MPRYVARSYGTRKRYSGAVSAVGKSARILGLIAKFGGQGGKRKFVAPKGYGSKRSAGYSRPLRMQKRRLLFRQKPATIASSISPHSQGSIRVCHREFVSKIYSNLSTGARYSGLGVTGSAVTDGLATYKNSIQSFRLGPACGINPAGVAAAGWTTTVTVGGTPSYPVGVNNGTTAWAPSTILPYGEQLAMFPWLSNIAAQYEQYKIHSMHIEYVPTAVNSTSAASNQMGSVDMYFEYNVQNALANPPTSQTSFLNNMNAISTQVTKPARMPILHGQSLNQASVYYNTNSSLAGSMPVGYPGLVAGGDVRLYDMATLFVCCYGQQVDRQEMGQLWISYDIELIKPQLGVC